MKENKNYKFDMYCLCLNNSIYHSVKRLGYIPVGLGDEKFENYWLRDNTKENISSKNQFYGEYTFHYWLWKNKLEFIPEKKWVGFCSYRRLWGKNLNSTREVLDENYLNHIPKEWENYNVILGKKVDISGIKFMKALKRGKKLFLKNPKALLRKNRNIKFQFDFMHGDGLLDKAIDLLNKEDRDDFKSYVNSNTSYNEGNMFVSNSKNLMKQYYDTVFPWLRNCESIFGFNLKGYAKIRIYAFLAERFLPYWFNKNGKVLEWPIVFYDLRNYK